jgi:hypothetical protein
MLLTSLLSLTRFAEIFVHLSQRSIQRFSVPRMERTGPELKRFFKILTWAVALSICSWSLLFVDETPSPRKADTKATVTELEGHGDRWLRYNTFHRWWIRVFEDGQVDWLTRSLFILRLWCLFIPKLTELNCVNSPHKLFWLESVGFNRQQIKWMDSPSSHTRWPSQLISNPRLNTHLSP